LPALNVPREQTVHVNEPVDGAWEPGEQSVQADAPSLGEKLPCGHGKQSISPVRLVISTPLPSVVVCVPSANCPAGHAKQTRAPSASANVPGKQYTHDEKPAAGECMLFGQGVHAVAPVSFWNVPAGQSVHCGCASASW
jgi:hypothetical protein